MAYYGYQPTGPTLQLRRPPWFMFLFLAVVFFLLHHDLSFSKRGIQLFAIYG